MQTRNCCTFVTDCGETSPQQTIQILAGRNAKHSAVVVPCVYSLPQPRTTLFADFESYLRTGHHVLPRDLPTNSCTLQTLRKRRFFRSRSVVGIHQRRHGSTLKRYQTYRDTYTTYNSKYESSYSTVYSSTHEHSGSTALNDCQHITTLRCKFYKCTLPTTTLSMSQ